VFLRPLMPPSTTWSLHGAPPAEAADGEVRTKNERKVASNSPSRRSGRIAEQTSDRESRRGQSKKSRGRGDRPLYQDPDTDEDEFDSSYNSMSDAGSRSASAHGSGDDDAKRTHIQGLCTMVSVTFDNQKARELQYGMEDFFSDDVDSGEEWTGDFEEDDAVMQF
jgi:hypothetical protein